MIYPRRAGAAVREAHPVQHLRRPGLPAIRRRRGACARARNSSPFSSTAAAAATTWCANAWPRMPRIRNIPNSGSFYAMFEIDGRRRHPTFCERAVIEARIGMAPGVAFGRGAERMVRLCYAKAPELLHTAMDRLRDLRRQLPGLTVCERLPALHCRLKNPDRVGANDRAGLDGSANAAAPAAQPLLGATSSPDGYDNGRIQISTHTPPRCARRGSAAGPSSGSEHGPAGHRRDTGAGAGASKGATTVASAPPRRPATARPLAPNHDPATASNRNPVLTDAENVRASKVIGSSRLQRQGRKDRHHRRRSSTRTTRRRWRCCRSAASWASAPSWSRCPTRSCSSATPARQRKQGEDAGRDEGQPGGDAGL